MNKSESLNKIPFLDIAKAHKTPTFVYDREVIEQRIEELKPFQIVRFAQKACSNIALLTLMRKKGVMVDAVSAGEIHRALRAGYLPGPGRPDVVYTADIFDEDAKEIIAKYKVPVNVGSPDMITQLAEFSPDSELILRINPGFGHGHSQKVNTGGNLSKHGIWHEDLELCKELAQKSGLKIHGLHMHIGSGSDFEHLSQVCESMVAAAETIGAGLQVISAGGGLPIPYQDSGDRIDIAKYHALWESARKKIESIAGNSVELEVEPGRYLAAEAGFLLTKICSIKNTGGTDFYLVDAGFNDLIRPAMYGAYHHLSILPQTASANTKTKDVVVAGPLCESCDVFTQDEGGFVQTRNLPDAQVGDYIIIHDAGAYGAAMSSNYNTKKLSTEVLVNKGQVDVIRDRQTFEAILQFERIPDSI